MNPTRFVSTTLVRPLALLACTAAVASLGAASPVQGGTQICDVCNVCIDCPQGALSFADQVLRYDPLAGGGPGPTAPNFIDPLRALGSPDYSSCGGGSSSTGAVSLGNGGLIELAFTNNLLTNGNPGQSNPSYSNLDLWIYEAGGVTEPMDVFVHPLSTTLPLLNPALDPDGDGYYFVGRVSGQPVGVDLDAVFPGFAPGSLLFDAVRIVDVLNGGSSSTVGADIDAVGAISSATPTVIQPYCFGVGCPCGNDDANAGCRNSTGAGGRLLATGTNSLASDDLVLTVQGLPARTFGFLFMGQAAAHAPFADGLRCVSPGPNQTPSGTGMFRFPIRATAGAGAFIEGPGIAAFAQTAFGATGTLLPGTTWHFQAHYRNPTGPCGLGSNLTNAVAVTFQ